MILKMYSIRDQKAEVFNTPFYMKTHGEAERNFAKATGDEKTMIHQYPKDFDLYYLGEYDDSKGKFTPIEAPQHIASAIQFAESSIAKAPQDIVHSEEC